MPSELDVRRLIAEVQKRPTLWDMRSAEYLDRSNTPHLWQEIADIMNVDVETCKRKWKNLRDAYRAEVRRAERRSEIYKANKQTDTKPNIASKWVFFQPMSFINESKRVRHSFPAVAHEGNSSSQEAKHLHSFCDIKLEPHHTTDEDDDDNDESETLLEEFQAITTPQAVRRLSHTISLANAAADDEESSAFVELADEESVSPTATTSASVSATDEIKCKCSKRADEQVHFLEDLEREELKLMQSTKQDMTRLDTVSHVGDADYNFLVSFLPQMKKMTELQNLRFRAKMSELLLNIMAPAMSGHAHGGTSDVRIQEMQPKHQQMMMHSRYGDEGNVMYRQSIQQKSQQQQQLQLQQSQHNLPHFLNAKQSASSRNEDIEDEEENTLSIDIDKNIALLDDVAGNNDVTTTCSTSNWN